MDVGADFRAAQARQIVVFGGIWKVVQPDPQRQKEPLRVFFRADLVPVEAVVEGIALGAIFVEGPFDFSSGGWPGFRYRTGPPSGGVRIGMS